MPGELASSEFYVDRPPIESQCYQEIVRLGAPIRIKAPQKMGKTRPIDRILLCAADGRYRTVRLNLVEPDRGTIADLNKFLRWFCCRVTRLLTNGRKTKGDRF
ncbi:MAG: AAA-like domain-containing protein [Hormoscilla sp. GUM202]|nr:AAA-like domain-containing protein [Hormoscilla sp. GUM202]